MAEAVSEVTRRNIVDYLVASETQWAGRLDEVEFLARLFDLNKLPSTDTRLKNAAGDIRQHRINWNDWDDDWVFHDSRLNLLAGPDDIFLRFLCETVHPVARDTEFARALVVVYNSELKADGWGLVETKQISGKPVFDAIRVEGRAEVFPEPTGWQKVDRQLQEVRMRLDSADSEEEYQAIGLLCRETLISLAQQVFDPQRHPVRDGVRVSATDADRMLDAFLSAELRGSADEEARGHAKAALKLAVALQHKRTADFRTAALCAEGTVSIVNISALLAGRTTPEIKNAAATTPKPHIPADDDLSAVNERVRVVAAALSRLNEETTASQEPQVVLEKESETVTQVAHRIGSPMSYLFVNLRLANYGGHAVVEQLHVTGNPAVETRPSDVAGRLPKGARLLFELRFDIGNAQVDSAPFASVPIRARGVRLAEWKESLYFVHVRRSLGGAGEPDGWRAEITQPLNLG